MKKNKKNNDKWQKNFPAACDCRHCVFYGGKKKGIVICLADSYTDDSKTRHPKLAYRRERSF